MRGGGGNLESEGACAGARSRGNLGVLHAVQDSSPRCWHTTSITQPPRLAGSNTSRRPSKGSGRPQCNPKQVSTRSFPLPSASRPPTIRGKPKPTPLATRCSASETVPCSVSEAVRLDAFRRSRPWAPRTQDGRWPRDLVRLTNNGDRDARIHKVNLLLETDLHHLDAHSCATSLQQGMSVEHQRMSTMEPTDEQPGVVSGLRKRDGWVGGLTPLPCQFSLALSFLPRPLTWASYCRNKDTLRLERSMNG